ncbi:hypothetical protein KR51_00023520 [Rubidibacter lacunae KORDI 51-2]|uniref:DUF7079 domain-containing protein n=1 Tax=Rubidibacter lacunae KORDI 51-2 TaxID=582515 RepID=U5DHK3_9CHRO|nr:hypothetical protein [Rubidibacter lacunae]ERN41091.1 hypothetical protein KR51_00023520 [Rubidibacter lacunae KORDI 51-2]
MEYDREFVENRLPVWRALSNLFLDTKLERSDYRLIAKEINDTGFSVTEVEQILWEEVFPALADNLRIVAGEWSGFSENWLQIQIMNVMNGDEKGRRLWGLMTVGATRKLIGEAWSDVKQILSSGK